jgi:hypothetical protein
MLLLAWKTSVLQSRNQHNLIIFIIVALGQFSTLISHQKICDFEKIELKELEKCNLLNLKNNIN